MNRKYLISIITLLEQSVVFFTHYGNHFWKHDELSNVNIFPAPNPWKCWVKYDPEVFKKPNLKKEGKSIGNRKQRENSKPVLSSHSCSRKPLRPSSKPLGLRPFYVRG